MRPLLAVGAGFAVGVGFAVAGCSGGAQPIAWQVHFEEPALADRMAALEARIVEGGCDGARIAYQATTPRGAAAAPVGRLADGRYGLLASAVDEGCAAYASACEEVDLPLAAGQGVSLVLRAGPERARCPAATCERGLCGAGLHAVPDATVPDAGPGEAIVADETCPGLRRRDGSCYRWFGRRLSWPAARGHCRDWGGELVTLDDRREQDFVLDHVAGSDRFWLGLNDRDEEMDWRWSSGSSAPFRDWADGEPNGTGPGGADCAEYRPDPGAWYDQDCGLDKRVLCERR